MNEWKKKIQNNIENGRKKFKITKDMWDEYDDLRAEYDKLSAELKQLRQEEPFNEEAFHHLQDRIIKRLREIMDDLDKHVPLNEASLELEVLYVLRDLEKSIDSNIISIKIILEDSIKDLHHVSNATIEVQIINRIAKWVGILTDQTVQKEKLKIQKSKSFKTFDDYHEKHAILSTLSHYKEVEQGIRKKFDIPDSIPVIYK